MVKSATLTSFIAEVSVKDYWENLYANGAAVTDFHNKFHGQQEVRTTEWVDNKRVVNMVVPLALPAFLRSITGKDKVPVQETQEFKWLDESTLEIHSVPLSLIPGGAKFNTKLEYQIEEGGEGITVTAKVFSHASGPFGLSGAIEKVMLEVATVQTQHWLEFSRDRCLDAPGKWWQQAGKISRALSRRMTMKPNQIDRVIKTSMKKIESDLDILEALEPKVNLGDVAKRILSDAQLKEAYAKTMMRTLFMLESAEDSKLDLTPAQAQELRDMLTQLQRTLANITRRKDELLAACLEYELESSERVRSLAQELQLARVSGPAAATRLLLPLAGPRRSASGEPLTKSEELELEFPGWEFLIRSKPLSDGGSSPPSSSGASSPSSRGLSLPSSSSRSIPRLPLPSSSDPPHCHHSASVPNLASAAPQGHHQQQQRQQPLSAFGSRLLGRRSSPRPSAASSAPLPAAPAAAAAAVAASSSSPSRRSSHGGSQSSSWACCDEPPSPSPFSSSSARPEAVAPQGQQQQRQSRGKQQQRQQPVPSQMMRHSQSAPSWASPLLSSPRYPPPLPPTPPVSAAAPSAAPAAAAAPTASVGPPGPRLLRELETCGPALVAGCLKRQCSSHEHSEPCPHLLLLGLLGDLAEQLEAEQQAEPGHERAETTKQVNITLKAQVAELKRQLTGSAPSTSAVTRSGGSASSGGRSVFLRRLFLGGVVVLVGRWGLNRSRLRNES